MTRADTPLPNVLTVLLLPLAALPWRRWLGLGGN